MDKQLKTRQEVDETRTWDLTHLFENEQAFEDAIKSAEEKVNRIVEQYKGQLTQSDVINACLDELRVVVEEVMRIGNYANLNLSVDQTNPKKVEVYMKTSQWLSTINSELSFIRSEIIEQDGTVIQEAMRESVENAKFLDEILRFKPYALDPAVEKTLVQLSPVFATPYNTYNQAKLADMRFEPFTVDGKEYPLSFSLFEDEWEYEPNTPVRREAFRAFSEKLSQYQNTVASLYNSQVQKEKIIANMRGYASVFDYLLFDQVVDQSLYHRQIDVIMEKLAPYEEVCAITETYTT